MAESMFKKRFLWFMKELIKESKIWAEADEVEAAGKDVDKYFRSQPDCYTPERWDKLENEIDQAWIKHWKSTPEGKKWLKENKKDKVEPLRACLQCRGKLSSKTQSSM